MKFLLFLICILIYFCRNSQSVVNSCGSNDVKNNTKIPDNVNDCKDPQESSCRFITVEKKGMETKKFCGIIHGKYNDREVIKEVNELINGKITVE